MQALISYLAQRADGGTFLLQNDLERTLRDLFPRPETTLPQPFKIFLADETQPPTLGFPVAESAVMKDLEQKLDRWLAEEIPWQVNRATNKEKAHAAFTTYISQLMKAAENALLS